MATPGATELVLDSLRVAAQPLLLLLLLASMLLDNPNQGVGVHGFGQDSVGPCRQCIFFDFFGAGDHHYRSRSQVLERPDQADELQPVCARQRMTDQNCVVNSASSKSVPSARAIIANVYLPTTPFEHL